jgi:hypothetical protein
VENQLRAIVQVYHPAVLHLFSSLDRDISLAFLRDYPTPEQAGRLGPARMTAFCARHGYSGRTSPEVLVERLRPTCWPAAPEPPRARPTPPDCSSTSWTCSTPRSGR